MARIVICEDHPPTCRMLERGLEQEGLTLAFTSTVQECQGLLSQGIPDLLLIDLLLQGENTLALIRQLRAEHRELRIIAMTGAGHEWVRAALVHGADGALEKPFLLDALEDLIGSLLPAAKVPQG